MRLLVEIDDVRHDVHLGRHHPSATLGDLVRAALGHRPEAGTEYTVGAARHTVETPLAAILLLEGSRIARSPEQRPRPVHDWTATLSGGLAAGCVIEIPRGRPLLVGRAPEADLVLRTGSASWSHLTVQHEGDGVRIRDAGSTNGTLVDGVAVDEHGVLVTGPAVVIAGGAALRVRPGPHETCAPEPGGPGTVARDGTVPFNRPPRPGRPTPSGPILPPTREPVAAATRFSVITVAAPLVLAVAMVLIMGDARYALFAALSPLAGLGMWFEQKYRHTRSSRIEEARFAEALLVLRDDIAQRARTERSRLDEEAPDPATVVRRAALPTTSLWQRRAGSRDALTLHAGVGDVPWDPPLDERAVPRPAEEVLEITRTSVLHSAPVVVDLTDAGVVGIVGDREGALALARSLLCQAAVHSGPADLTIGVFCDRGRGAAWSWAAWLPHSRRHGGDGGRWLSDRPERGTELLRSLHHSPDTVPTAAVLLVIDSETLTGGRDAPARDLLGRGRGEREPGSRVSGIVLAAAEEQLPATCTVVVHVEPDAVATVLRPDERVRVGDVVVAGLDLDTAERCARDLARFEDPELGVAGAGLPALVRLPPLLGPTAPSSSAVRTWWASARGIAAPIGVGEGGAFILDLVRDGPHGLVGGTTGSGKSEFLRSFVGGLAAWNDPTRLSFILIDFKGGAAFAACERLPHTIGTISNLDAQLADRALRSLEAELRRRQRVFAAAGEGIDSIDAYWATAPAEPMPRILLVVDEFAMLAKEHPEVLSSLVSVGAVGRTLGVHMILATQRPAGVVNDDILANTNLRVALRVQSRDDSVNVIGEPGAAGIPRSRTGRAYVKLGQNDITPVQTALITGRAAPESSEAVELHSVDFAGTPLRAPTPETAAAAASNDLDLLIDAVVAAAAEAGTAPPRPVWPEPLGERVPLDGSAVTGIGRVVGDVLQIALSDDPDRQRRITSGWDLGAGNLLLIGIPGSGTSTALAALALTAAGHFAPDELDLLVLDAASNDSAPLEGLPHSVAYVGAGAGSHEKQTRFLRYLRDEVRRRRASSGPRRRLLVLIDGLATLKDEFQDYEGLALLDGLYRAYAEGPELGVHVAVTTTRVRAVPSALEEVTTQKWLFRLAEPHDYSIAGLEPRHAPARVPGRCVITASRLQTQVAVPSVPLHEAVAEVLEAWPGHGVKPAVIGTLPERVTAGAVQSGPLFDGRSFSIPIGLDDADLAPLALPMFDGEHLLVAGPARSGKSSVLLGVAEAALAARSTAPALAVWGACDRRSPVAAAALDRLAVGADRLRTLLAALDSERSPVLLLIDDAERWDDADGVIARLVSEGRPGLGIMAAGRSSELRSMYGHWTRLIARSRSGLLLQPDLDHDGVLLGAQLPRRTPAPATVGRGFASVAGELHFVQSISPTPGTAPEAIRRR